MRRRRTTAGTRHVTDGERISSSYSTTTSTVSSYLIFTASCQRRIRIGKYQGVSRRVRVCMAVSLVVGKSG